METETDQNDPVQVMQAAVSWIVGLALHAQACPHCLADALRDEANRLAGNFQDITHTHDVEDQELLHLVEPELADHLDPPWMEPKQ